MKKYMFLVIFVSFFLVISCAPPSHFGVKDQAIGVPSIFDETEDAIALAEKSPGAKYCPEKIAKAKELGKKAAETYWACRTAEAMELLAQARSLAKEAEGCKPPAPAPSTRHLQHRHLHHHACTYTTCHPHQHLRHLHQHLRQLLHLHLHHRHPHLHLRHRHPDRRHPHLRLHHRHLNRLRLRCSKVSILISTRQTLTLQPPRHWIRTG